MFKNLLSIGEIAKITGVHISSLRYYDRIGVLKPAYIDPDTNYRYYTYSQMATIEAIQACIELDIPLKEYLNFTGNDGQTIHAEALLEYGKLQAEKKLQSIRKSIQEIEQCQQEIAHSKRLLSASAPIKYHVPEKYYYVVPVPHALFKDNYKSMNQLPLLIQNKGYEIGMDYGFIYFYKESAVERYQFIEIIPEEPLSDEHVITLPSGFVLAKAAAPDKIEEAALEFPELFQQSGTKTVVLKELLTENVDVNQLPYELKCYLQQ